MERYCEWLGFLEDKFKVEGGKWKGYKIVEKLVDLEEF